MTGRSGWLDAEVLDDVARVVGAPVAPRGRLSGGVNGGAVRVELGGGSHAVLKAVPRTHPDHSDRLDEALRGRRLVEHLRAQGYPTPAWLAVGATASHVWHLMDFVDAAPAAALTPSLVEQLMEIVELQAGQATEPYDHWAYAWRLATGQDHGHDLAPSLSAAVAGLPGHSPAVAGLVARLRHACADVPAPRGAPDAVHTDLNPGNVLVRDGVVAAVVDIANAGSGTRATDLVTLVWQTLHDSFDHVRAQLWSRILDLVGPDGAAVLAATQVLVSLEVPVRHGRHDLVPGTVEQGHRLLEELNTFR